MKTNSKFLLALAVLFIVIVAYAVSKNAGKDQVPGTANMSAEETVKNYFELKAAGAAGDLYPDYLSKTLYDKLSEMAASGIAYDPVLCAEDQPTDIRVETVNSNEDTVNYIVSEAFSDGSDTKVAVRAKNVRGYWLLDDINCFAPKPKIAQ